MQPQRCTAEWPVCPDCLGQGLTITGGQASCPRCFRAFGAETVVPCPWPATHALAASDGATVVCASHAEHPSAAGLALVALR